MQFSRTYQDLTPEECLGESFMPRLEANQYVEDQEYARGIDRMVTSHQAGGFCVFGATPESTIKSISRLQRLAIQSHGIPLIFSADCEWGLPMRLTGGGTEFPDAMALGRADDPSQTEEVGRAIAKEMKALGLGWNFAPVADVNSNPKNPIINTRSFGVEAEGVSRNVQAFVRGLESERVAGSIKHFPGHGDTEVDSHKEMPMISGGRDRFEQLEFIPFRQGIASQAKSIMLGHIATPQLVADLGSTNGQLKLPATLSKPICDMIREEWEYDGVLVTDGLEMHGLTKYFENEEACLRSYTAGVDVLLLPVDANAAYRRLLDACRSGEISEDRLRESARRVLELKQFVDVPTDPFDTEFVILNQEHLELAHKAARRALEFRGQLPDSNFSSVVVISDSRNAAIEKANYFIEHAGLSIRHQILTPETNSEQERIELGAKPLIVILHRARGFISGLSGASSVPQLLTSSHDWFETAQSITVAYFGSPYLEPYFEGMPVTCSIKTFSESTTSIDVVLDRMKHLL